MNTDDAKKLEIKKSDEDIDCKQNYSIRCLNQLCNECPYYIAAKAAKEREENLKIN